MPLPISVIIPALNEAETPMNIFTRGQFVESDGLLAVVVGTPEDGGAPDNHLTLWYGEPECKRISHG